MSKRTSPQDFSRLATGRTVALFESDMAAVRERIEESFSNRRVLVVGGAGSIGSATVKRLLGYRPSLVCVVDHNENGLVELVRDLRSDGATLAGSRLRLLPLDFGSPVMKRFVDAEEPFDVVLNCAAVKHVRSEKDVFSILQMVSTNVLKGLTLVEWLAQRGGTRRYFCVSTDKAAKPTSVMGATKQLMEQSIFSARSLVGFEGEITTTRFANVAFSDGSLLDGWTKRLLKGQPLAVPSDTKRYFLASAEGASLCVLAAAASPSGWVLVPRVSPEMDLVELSEVCERFLHNSGYEPAYFAREGEMRNALPTMSSNQYPVLVTPRDTDGEKGYEEFAAPGEESKELGFRDILGLRLPAGDVVELGRVLGQLRRWVEADAPAVEKRDVIDVLSSVVRHFSHVETGMGLDERF